MDVSLTMMFVSISLPFSKIDKNISWGKDLKIKKKPIFFTTSSKFFF